MEKIVKTVCKDCTQECGVLVTVNDGKAVKITGDPECTWSHGHICPMGANFIQGTLYHPDRLMYPMKRIGKKGEGKWERISWEAAMNEVTDRLLEIKAKHGPLSLACAVDGWHYVLTGQLIRALGSPNIIASIEHCEGPGYLMDRILIGCGCTQYSHGPDCAYSKFILAWAKNAVDTSPPRWRDIIDAMSKGAKLVVIDPRRTLMAEKADIWLQPRPGSDGALVLAMLNVIINEGLYDKEFVEKWCFGIDKLRERVAEYSPEKVEKIVWIGSKEIKEVSRMYASTKPASLLAGIGLRQRYGATAIAHAQVCLVAITGNIDVKGGNLLTSRHVPPGFMSAYKFLSPNYPEHIEPEEITDQRIGALEFPLWSGRESHTSAPNSELIIKAILTGKPYPIKGLISHGQNMICQMPNAREVYEALKSLDLFVTFNYMASPTTELADFVFPVATWMERDEIPLFSFVWTQRARPRVKAVETLGECRDEQQVALDLYWKLIEKGLKPLKSRTGADFIKWKTLEEFLDYCVRGVGITWKEYKEKGYLEHPIEYKTYEHDGFNTPSGKVELYSKMLERFGLDPLPSHREPPESPISTPDLAQIYPLILITSRIKGNLYFHSSNRWATWARKKHPDPQSQIHPEVANKNGIKDGDWVWIETQRGRMMHRAWVTDQIHPNVINVEPGWWFPEKGPPLYGCFDCNVSVVSTSDRPYDPVEGTATFGVQLCRVYKSEETDQRQRWLGEGDRAHQGADEADDSGVS